MSRYLIAAILFIGAIGIVLGLFALFTTYPTIGVGLLLSVVAVIIHLMIVDFLPKEKP